MAYQVALADSAKADADSIYRWIFTESPRRGPDWFKALIAALYSLEQLPNRCPLAREARKARRKIRCLLFGKQHGVYRILYEVAEARQMVWILHIRHGARQDLGPDKLAEVTPSP